MTRRDILRGLTLTALALSASGLLEACGDESGGAGSGGTDLTLAASDVERAAADPAAIASGVTTIAALGAGLWAQLSGEPGNLAVSPYSVAAALGMTANGAVGTTLEEMLQVLSAESRESLNAGLNAVTQHIESLAGPVKRWEDDDAEISLDAANSLFGQRGVTWEEPFLDALAASYGAGVRQVDYEADAEAVREVINEWVAEQTRDKIPTLIPEGMLSAMTRLVLVNCLYLKAPWEDEFSEGATEEGTFTLADGGSVRVPLMKSGGSLPGIGGVGWRGALIPYAGGRLAMSVVLPDAEGLEPIDEIVAAGLDVVVRAAPGEGVDLTMPRWTYRVPSPLGDALKALGMPTAFDAGAADFSGMTAEEQLFIAAVVHEVYIAVDEKGTEAAAATAVVMETTSAPMPGTPLVLDRPFLFVIHDTEYGTPLFVGRVVDPT